MSRHCFSLRPTPPFRLDLAAWTLRRRAENRMDRWDGERYSRILALPGGPAAVEVAQPGPADRPRLDVAVTCNRFGPTEKAAVVDALERLLGLRVDLGPFYRFALNQPNLGDLARRFVGMKPPRLPTLFECLANAIACQQVSLASGISLLNRLTDAFGLGFGDEGPPRAFPRAEDLAGRDSSTLRPLGFSRNKARALIELADVCASGDLDLRILDAMPDGAALDRLSRLRGVGRWSAEYVLLRGLGRLHVFPGDDVGARNRLVRWLKPTEAADDYDKVHRLIARWSDFGGLIYFHLLLDRLDEMGLLDRERTP